MLAATGESFTFAAAGDWADPPDGAGVFSTVLERGAQFIIGLGDLGYTSNEQSWCSDAEAQTGNKFLVIAGNHDTSEDGPGIIGNYQQYCTVNGFNLVEGPDSADGTSGYGVEYYLDYPTSAPIARFILAATGVSAAGSYSPGSPEYDFIANAIDTARATGIQWVIFGNHKPCVSSDTSHSDCGMGQDAWDLILDKKVDLVMHGHSHLYERSKLLGPGTTVMASGDNFQKGQGTIATVQGTGGNSLYSYDSGNGNAQYWEAWDDSDYGAGVYTITNTALTGTFYTNSGTLIDSFSVGGSTPSTGGLAASFTTSPASPGVDQTVTFVASATGGVAPYSFGWDFGDGPTSFGQTTTHVYSIAGSYTVTLTGLDSAGQSATASKTLTVTTVVPLSGQPSTVCVVRVGITSCPSSTPTFSVRTWNTVTVSIIIQGSDMINGFDITVQTDPGFIQPQNATLTGTILPNPFILLNQVNHTAGTVRVAAISISGQVPGNGLLFSITYQAIARTNGSPISLTSVTVVDGSSSPVPILTQDGKFQARGPRRKH